MFISYTNLKKMEKENPKGSEKALLNAFIIATTVTSVVVVISPMIQDNVLFVSLGFGIVTFFAFYTSAMNIIQISKDEKDEK